MGTSNAVKPEVITLLRKLATADAPAIVFPELSFRRHLNRLAGPLQQNEHCRVGANATIMCSPPIRLSSSRPCWDIPRGLYFQDMKGFYCRTRGRCPPLHTVGRAYAVAAVCYCAECRLPSYSNPKGRRRPKNPGSMFTLRHYGLPKFLH